VIEDVPSLARKVMAELSHRLRRANSKIESLAQFKGGPYDVELQAGDGARALDEMRGAGTRFATANDLRI